MKIVIHAGMHKTGSSSIQHTFSKCSDPKLSYANWRSANHSGMFALLFGPIEDTLNYHVHRKRGLTLAEAEADRAMWWTSLEKDISNSEGKTFVFSAELLSSLGNRPRLEQAAQFFKSRGEVRVIAYVRPPISFMQSAMQQRLKGGSNLDHFSGLYPKYRMRFEVLDDLFGCENVELIKFDRKSLRREDVVFDFGSRLGIDISQEEIEQRNESLSLEAAGALYIQRVFGSGISTGYPQATAANGKFISTIQDLGSKKIVFSAEMVQPVIERFSDDIAWIEKRLGQSLLDLASDNPTVSSYDDLVDGAIRIIPEIEYKLGVPQTNQKSIEYAVQLMEQIKNECEILVRSKPASKISMNTFSE